MNLGTATVIRGDARNLPLPDACVDLIVTSPPYFALRSYQDGGEHYDGQVGSEATPAEFVDALIECTREMMRVLKPSGSIFVNLGDKYSQRVAIRPSSHQDGLFPDREDLPKDWKRDKDRGLTRMPYQNVIDQASGNYVREKSLMGIPWRYALRCIDDLGLILRAEIIWSKPNGLPESVTDRVRRSHEQWFHFTVQPRYFSAVDEIREEHGATNRDKLAAYAKAKGHVGTSVAPDGRRNRGIPWDEGFNPLGKLPGSVRTVPTSPLTVPAHLGIDHFAAFPPAWPEWIIRGWSPGGVCTACGEGRRPVVERATTPDEVRRLEERKSSFKRTYAGLGGQKHQDWLDAHPPTITGYACACPTPDAPTTPATILDPFGGTGTTALVAKALGRNGISVDLSQDYCKLATWRTNDPGELARVLGVDKPAPQVEGQWDLFGGEAS